MTCLDARPMPFQRETVPGTLALPGHLDTFTAHLVRGNDRMHGPAKGEIALGFRGRACYPDNLVIFTNTETWK